MKTKQPIGKMIAVAAAIVAADQAVKYWACTVLQAKGSIAILPNIFALTYAQNTGAAFSILEGKRLFFIVMTLAMVGILFWMARKGHIRGKIGWISAAFVIGGAVGNAIDRAWRGFVVDLFDFQLIHFAIFNVADIFITVGGLLLVIYFAFLEEKTAGGKQEHETGESDR